ncbi:molecular chaperone HtpG [Thermospira aquatica]|uniref:Chaperone protein HtpG n=1 Tax=Thermospira aquatica TaxID=2828656 RepID=A0AAX3BCZ2_9SPIR|nr:molecular chaperone HtpG [Thermospira aquatica]URA09963.1 molecular chaperone HtpG [Thermospira aquatica]
MERYSFQAESRELLDLMVHAIYSQKEVFLRELLSNASDALDKLRLLSLTNAVNLPEGHVFEIRIDRDSEKRVLVIEDSGVGMNHDELVNNLGTIARSGTKEFLQQIKEKNTPASELIGQFGVGFYSMFMVAERVEVFTRKAGETQGYHWVSDGKGEFTIEPVEKDTIGTRIVIHLKPVDEENGIEDFTREDVIRRIVKRYSDFISYPIKMKVIREENKEKKEVEETLNSMKPLWTRKPSEVSEDEYHDFYKHLTHDWENPLATITLQGEGTVEFQALLFIPSRVPFDIFYQSFEPKVNLYVKRVLIQENVDMLLPRYLRFVAGVVDSPDLSLNISREMLQQDKTILQVRKRLVKKILDTLLDMQEKDREKYTKFWQEFGVIVKEGIGADYENKEKLLSLLLFESSAGKDLITLEEYVKRMKEDQKEIYYLTGESRRVLETSPYMEAVKDKGYEVLFLTQPIDEFMMSAVHEFQGKKFHCLNKEPIEEKAPEVSEEDKPLLEKLQTLLSDHVREVKFSTKLVDSPACVMTKAFEFSPHVRKILGEKYPFGDERRILEINPKHPLFERFKGIYEENKEDARLEDLAQLFLGYALIAEGTPLPDPARFNALVLKMAEKL